MKGKKKGEKGVEEDKLEVEVEVERATEEGSGQNGSFHFWGTGTTVYPGRSDTRALGERRDSLDAGLLSLHQTSRHRWFLGKDCVSFVDTYAVFTATPVCG